MTPELAYREAIEALLDKKNVEAALMLPTPSTFPWVSQTSPSSSLLWRILEQLTPEKRSLMECDALAVLWDKLTHAVPGLALDTPIAWDEGQVPLWKGLALGGGWDLLVWLQPSSEVCRSLCADKDCQIAMLGAPTWTKASKTLSDSPMTSVLVYWQQYRQQHAWLMEKTPFAKRSIPLEQWSPLDVDVFVRYALHTHSSDRLADVLASDVLWNKLDQSVQRLVHRKLSNSMYMLKEVIAQACIKAKGTTQGINATLIQANSQMQREWIRGDGFQTAPSSKEAASFVRQAKQHILIALATHLYAKQQLDAQECLVLMEATYRIGAQRHPDVGMWSHRACPFPLQDPDKICEISSQPSLHAFATAQWIKMATDEELMHHGRTLTRPEHLLSFVESPNLLINIAQACWDRLMHTPHQPGLHCDIRGLLNQIIWTMVLSSPATDKMRQSWEKRLIHVFTKADPLNKAWVFDPILDTASLQVLHKKHPSNIPQIQAILDSMALQNMFKQTAPANVVNDPNPRRKM